jgi:hypothetical protein
MDAGNGDQAHTRKAFVRRSVRVVPCKLNNRSWTLHEIYAATSSDIKLQIELSSELAFQT